jgi:hypothetical protein
MNAETALAAYASRHAGSSVSTPAEIQAQADRWSGTDAAEGRTPEERAKLEMHYWIASYRRLHAATLKLASALASHREEILCGDDVYKVESDPDAPTAPVRVSKVFCRDPHVYTIEGHAEVSTGTLTAGPHAGYSCDCPDFTHRHAGTPSPGCKHIAGASRVRSPARAARARAERRGV